MAKKGKGRHRPLADPYRPREKTPPGRTPLPRGPYAPDEPAPAEVVPIGAPRKPERE